MWHPFRAADEGKLSPAKLLAGALLVGAVGGGGVVGGVVYEQHVLRSDLCVLIDSVQPRSAQERNVGAYGLRIQDGSRTSGQRIGCNLPPALPSDTPSPGR